MRKDIKIGMFQALVLLMMGVFLTSITGCCPAGSGCDWYSSDHEKQEQPKKE